MLDWLTASGLDLASAGQGDLEQWLTSRHPTARVDAGNFLRWASRNKLTSLSFAATKWDGPRRVIDSEARWAHARQLLHDDSIKAEDRVAGLLVLLYAQSTTAISRLTLEHVHAGEHDVRLRLGREPIVLPEPLDVLVCELVDYRHGHATLGDQGTSRWLSPAGNPADRSAPTGSANGFTNSACAQDKTAPPPCSASQPNSPQHCSPDCSESTSASPSPDNAPPPETGPPTPPTTAAAATRPTSPTLRPMIVRESYSESSNIPLRQNTPISSSNAEPSIASPRSTTGRQPATNPQML